MQVRNCGLLLVSAALLAGAASGQTEEHHRRGYKPLPTLAHIVVTVEKGYNDKPLENAAVIFHSIRDGKDDGSLEVKTDLDGKATIDLIEVGANVKLQVLADGFATYADSFDVTTENKELLVKLQRPREQISAYQDNTDKAAVRPLGVQEPDRTVTTNAVQAAVGATVSGTVKDTTGARIPGAVVSIVNKIHPEESFKMATGQDGKFSRNRLTPGTYEIKVQAVGFVPVTHSGVVLSQGDNRIMDEALEVAPNVSVSPIPTAPAGSPK